MEKGPDLDDLSRFNSFCESPKTCSDSKLQATHRFLLKSLSDKRSPVTKSIVINILMKFVPNEIKEYHFRRMTRAILVELAICIVQDLIQNGPGRGQSLELQLVKTSSGGAKVVIADPFVDDDGKYDEDFLREIDEIDAAEFTLRDKSGSTPDKRINTGQGFAQPFLEPDAEGCFITPQKAARKPNSYSVPTVGPSKLAFVQFHDPFDSNFPHLLFADPGKRCHSRGRWMVPIPSN